MAEDMPLDLAALSQLLENYETYRQELKRHLTDCNYLYYNKIKSSVLLYEISKLIANVFDSLMFGHLRPRKINFIPSTREYFEPRYYSMLFKAILEELSSTICIWRNRLIVYYLLTNTSYLIAPTTENIALIKNVEQILVSNGFPTEAIKLQDGFSLDEYTFICLVLHVDALASWRNQTCLYFCYYGMTYYDMNRQLMRQYPTSAGGRFHEALMPHAMYYLETCVKENNFGDDIVMQFFLFIGYIWMEKKEIIVEYVLSLPFMEIFEQYTQRHWMRIPFSEGLQAIADLFNSFRTNLINKQFEN